MQYLTATDYKALPQCTCEDETATEAVAVGAENSAYPWASIVCGVLCVECGARKDQGQ